MDFRSYIIGNTPYLIAEIGVNYYEVAQKEGLSLLEAAKTMINCAAKAGVSAVKFQSYKADTLATKKAPLWGPKKEKSVSQFELFKKFDKFSAAEYKELAEYTTGKEIDFLSTPFDFESVDYLYEITPFYKIASADITNLPFLEYIASTKKPILLSTGAASMEEIRIAVRAIEKNDNFDICILHSVLEYPTPVEDANIYMIENLREEFPDYLIGYSDHTVPDKHMEVLTASFLLGAHVLEKHFTLDKTLPGNEHYHSMDIQDIVILKKRIAFLKKAGGSFYKNFLPGEINARHFARRSVVAAIDIPKGAVIAAELLTLKRPGTGIPPYDMKKILGRKAGRDIPEDTTITEDMLE